MSPKVTTGMRRQALLRREDVAAWYKDHAKAATAETQLAQLELFLRRTSLDVDRLIGLARKDGPKFRTLVLDYIRTEQRAGRKSRYVLNNWWGVRSFLKSIHAASDWNPKIEPTEADDESGSSIVPSHEQLRDIAAAVKSSRDRAAVLFLASSGVRIGALATQFGPADGLRLKHLVDLELEPEMRFTKVPPLVRVPAHLSKGKHGYYSAITNEAAEAILVMLRERKSNAEKLTPESALFPPDTRGRHSERRASDGTAFMTRKALAARVRSAMDRVKPEGVEWHAHTLRAWFSTQLEACESRGILSRTRREYFMGHTLGVDGVYNLNRALPPSKLEELRATYSKCESFLETTKPAHDTRDRDIETRRLLLLALGYSEGSVAKMDVPNMTHDELIKAIEESPARSDSAGAQPSQRPPGKASTSPAGFTYQQKLIDETELATFLERGWRAKMPVNGSKFIVERST